MASWVCSNKKTLAPIPVLETENMNGMDIYLLLRATQSQKGFIATANQNLTLQIIKIGMP